MLRTLALIALAPALASAKTSVSRDARAGEPSKADEQDATQFVIGEAGVDVAIDKLHVVVPSSEVTTVKLTFTLSTRSNERRHAVIPLALPDTARVVGAAVTIGTTERVVATTLSPLYAREQYQQLFQVGKDPLLVEQVNDALDTHAIANDAFEGDHMRAFEAFAIVPPHASDRAGLTNYVIRAFPLMKRATARVELTIELREYASSRLVIEHAQRIGLVEVETVSTQTSAVLAVEDREPTLPMRRRNVSAPIAVPLPANQRVVVGVAKLAERAHVSSSESFYAGSAPNRIGPMPTVTIDHSSHSSDCFVDGRDIRRTVKQHRLQLARCYTKVTEYRGGPEGTAVLHFLIDTNGSVSTVTIDGEIDDKRITTCLEEEVRGWEFHSGDARVMVNYPLRFQIAR